MAKPRLWFKHDGRLFEAQGIIAHQHAAEPATNLAPPRSKRASDRCAEKGPCRVQCLNLPCQPSVSERHLIGNRSDGLGACLMYNDPAGVLCVFHFLFRKKTKVWERRYVWRNISKGRHGQGARGPALPPPVTWDGCYTCTAPTPLSQ